MESSWCIAESGATGPTFSPPDCRCVTLSSPTPLHAQEGRRHSDGVLLAAGGSQRLRCSVRAACRHRCWCKATTLTGRPTCGSSLLPPSNCSKRRCSQIHKTLPRRGCEAMVSNINNAGAAQQSWDHFLLLYTISYSFFYVPAVTAPSLRVTSTAVTKASSSRTRSPAAWPCWGLHTNIHPTPSLTRAMFPLSLSLSPSLSSFSSLTSTFKNRSIMGCNTALNSAMKSDAKKLKLLIICKKSEFGRVVDFPLNSTPPRRLHRPGGRRADC